jgi:signal transduction histidine kinase
LLRRHIPSA